jgi:hypothetical protein
MKKGLGYVIAYLAWAVTMALGVWFILISREGVLGVLVLYAGDSLPRMWQAKFLDKAYVVVVGLLWLVLVIVAEEYFKRGVPQRDLMRRIANVVGPELLLIFVADVGLLLLQGIGSAGWLRWLILGGELVIGMALFLLGRFLRPPKPGEADN